MKLYEDLIGEIETALDKYCYEKYEGADLDEITKQELFNERQSFLASIKEAVEELDGTVDGIMEQNNEPSDYEYYCRQDDLRRYENLRGA